jgi:two-component system sensor histidine kinase MtrB
VLVRDVQRLRELVLDLLELARLDAGADEVRLEPLDVTAALRTTIDALHLADDVTVTVAADDGLLVVADRGRFRRIVANLTVNAAVHGGHHITVTASEVDGEVRIRVEDDGPGITPEQAAKIFDRFYKSDTSRAQGGSGLGLAIAREHARAQGGDVEVAEASGGGAAFVLRLPVGTPDTEPSEPDPHPGRTEAVTRS